MGNLFYLFFLIPVIVANLGERNSAWRTLAYILLAAINLGLLGLAGIAVLMAWMARRTPGSFPSELAAVNWPGLIATILLTALGASLPLVPAVRRWLALRPAASAGLALRPAASAGLAIDPESAVHTTALIFAVYQVGNTFAQTALLGTIETLAGAQYAVTILDLLTSSLWFTLLALTGTGLLVRRNARQTAERLGLAWPTWRQTAAAAALLVGLLVVGIGVDVAWQQLDPGSYERIDRITRNLFGGLDTTWEALLLGLSAGIGEELLFRGAVQPRLRLLPTALLFAVGHLQYGLSPAAGQVLIVGLALGVLRNRANTTLCIAVHALYNIINVLLG